MSELMELVERVKASTGPDREIDLELAMMDGWRKISFYALNINGSSEHLELWVPGDADEETISEYVSGIKAEVAANLWRDYDGYPAYSASIDDALALVERKLPDANCVGIELERGQWCGYVSRNGVKTGHWYKEAYAPTAPLAILAALLSALTSGASS